MPEPSPPPLLVICGPTASGKTSLALGLAASAPIEVISADSRQVYRGLDVGTAKPTAAEQRRLPHHLIDVVDPDQTFSAYQFVRGARAALADVRARGRIPVVVGGSGFYVGALLSGSPLGAAAPDPKLRERLERELQAEGPHALVRRLHELDPARAAAIDPRNARRLIRAIEVASARVRSATQPRRDAGGAPVPAVTIGLAVDPHDLARRIARRAERMFDDGLLDEAQALRERGYAPDLPALSGVGYREALACLDGALTRAQAVTRTVERTRQYARRQRTWFRHQLAVDWRAPDHAADAAATWLRRAHER